MNSIIDGIDYGPLAQLIGKWVGNNGIDNAPDAQANPDKTLYADELIFSPAGRAENAEEQELVSVKYSHIVRKLENGMIFHDQIGHWIFEPATGTIMHSLTIPRAVCLLAGGKYQQKNNSSEFKVEASQGAQDFGIIQSPFMLEKAKTTGFKMLLKVTENTLEYHQTTSLEIYGKTFEHTDSSVLNKVLYETD